MIDDDVLSAPVLYLRDARSRAAGEVAELARNDAGHVKALRLAPEDPVRVTDGHGVLWGARLLEGGSSVRLLDRLEAPPRLEVELWAAVGNKQATLWLVEKAAEFGVRRLRPVECRRSVSVADAGRSRGFWAKAERRALAAVKQSGSAWAPELDEPATLPDRLAGLKGDRPRFVLDRTGPPLAEALAGWSCAEPIVLLIGPEGGLTGEERVACDRAGFRPASLGPTILRFETAAVAALAIAAQRSLAARNETSTEGAENVTTDQRDDCLFCRIYAGEIPADKVAEGEDWMAFRDIDPQAPVHVLIIPRRHVESVAAFDPDDAELAGRLLLAAAETARQLGVEEDGYRLVTNRGEKAGQSVFHLHLHLLAGRRMNWPPG